MKGFSIIILAAGKGKRMNNPSMAKVMALISGKPLIHYVLEQAILLNYDKLALVVGHQKRSVIEYANSLEIVNLEFIEQNEQLGTGHAVAQCSGLFEGYTGDIMILAGDVPLIKFSTLNNFYEEHKKSGSILSDLTVRVPNPKGYGRIIRDAQGSFIRIVEEKDGNPEELAADEINSGIFIVKSNILFEVLKQLSNKNAQGEYYLTDIAAILREKGYKLNAILAPDYMELSGVNSVTELAAAEEYFLKSKSD